MGCKQCLQKLAGWHRGCVHVVKLMGKTRTHCWHKIVVAEGVVDVQRVLRSARGDNRLEKKRHHRSCRGRCHHVPRCLPRAVAMPLTQPLWRCHAATQAGERARMRSGSAPRCSQTFSPLEGLASALAARTPAVSYGAGSAASPRRQLRRRRGRLPASGRLENAAVTRGV